MAWDLQVESLTGDLVFSPAHDLAGVSGEGLLRQRVSIRMKIPRGTYMYDEDGTLGSNLYLVPRSPTGDEIEGARAAITLALEPMRDEITVTEITFEKTSNNQLQANILFVPVVTDSDNPTIDPSSDSEIDVVSVNVSQD